MVDFYWFFAFDFEFVFVFVWRPFEGFVFLFVVSGYVFFGHIVLIYKKYIYILFFYLILISWIKLLFCYISKYWLKQPNKRENIC